MIQIDEAIARAEDVAKENERIAFDLTTAFNMETIKSKECKKCANEYRQIAEWLKDYKRLKEQEPFREVKKKGKDGRVDMTDSSTDSSTAGDCISREDALLCLTGEIKETDTAEAEGKE